MASASDSLPDDYEALKAAFLDERAARIAAEAKAQSTQASAEALIAHLKLAIEKLKRELHGSKSERGRKLVDQMELELEELKATATQDEIAAEIAAKAAGAAFVPAHTPPAAGA